MRRFTQLFVELDRTKRTSEKLAAIQQYFREAPAADAAWALYFLSGRKLKRLIASSALHAAIVKITNIPDWLIGESYEAVGDFAETLALLIPDQSVDAFDLPLHQLVNQRMLALQSVADPQRQIDLIIQTWSELNRDQRLV